MLLGLLPRAGLRGTHCAMQICSRVRPLGRTLQCAHLVCVCKYFIGNTTLWEKSERRGWDTMLGIPSFPGGGR